MKLRRLGSKLLQYSTVILQAMGSETTRVDLSENLQHLRPCSKFKLPAPGELTFSCNQSFNHLFSPFSQIVTPSYGTLFFMIFFRSLFVLLYSRGVSNS
jgi:hypothetical protein